MDRTRNQQSDHAADAPFDMRRLAKLALWGTAAASTLALAVLIGTSETGMRRMSFAVASWGRPDASKPEARLAGTSIVPQTPASHTPISQNPPPVIVQRDPEALAEARRLTETVRAIAADRDRLQTRLSALERNFEDVTGSIKREISATRPLPPTPLPEIDLPSMTDKPAAPVASPAAEKLQNLPKIASSPAVEATPAPAPNPSPSLSSAPSGPLPGAILSTAPVVAAAPAPPNSANALIAMAPLDPPLIGITSASFPPFGLPGMPALPPTPAASSATEVSTDTTAFASPIASASTPRIEFGIDIGGASNIEMIRAQWSMLKAQHPKLLESLTPVVSVRDLRQRRTVELRLVAGPLTNANAAAQLCAALNAAGLPTCQPAVFDGQRLALR